MVHYIPSTFNPHSVIPVFLSNDLYILQTPYKNITKTPTWKTKQHKHWTLYYKKHIIHSNKVIKTKEILKNDFNL